MARQMVAGGKHGESWQHYDPLVLDMYKKIGGASVMLRHFARMHEGVKLYRQAEHALREFKLNDPWYIKPTETGWPRLGSDRGDPRRAMSLDRGQGRQDQELPDHRADDVERRTAVRGRHPRSDGRGLDRLAHQGCARSGRSRSCLPLLRLHVWFAPFTPMMQRRERSWHGSERPDRIAIMAAESWLMPAGTTMIRSDRYRERAVTYGVR